MMSFSRLSVLRAAARNMRSLSAAAGDVVGDIISFARGSYKTNYEQAVDVLKSGLSFEQQTGRGAGRLYLAEAEIEADRSRWPEVSHLCRQAAAAASDCQPASAAEALTVAEVELAAAMMGTRAFLTQHKDAEAFEMAQQCMEVARKSFTATGDEDRRWQGLVLANAVAATVQHAAGQMDSAADSFESVLSLADHHDQQHGPVKFRDPLVAQALKQAAAFRLAQGHVEQAEKLAARALAGAQTAAELANGSTDALASPLITQEAEADAHLLAAQVSMELKAWERAEEQLSGALAVAEALDGHSPVQPRVALVLLLLGGVYARTGRLTLAEGLYKQAARTYRLSPGSAEAVDLRAVHPSVGFLLAWRSAQLMTALPNRGTEAAGWARLGRELYEDAPLLRALAPETVLGTLDVLQGKGAAGHGVVVDLMTRRTLPRAPPLPEL